MFIICKIQNYTKILSLQNLSKEIKKFIKIEINTQEMKFSLLLRAQHMIMIVHVLSLMRIIHQNM